MSQTAYAKQLTSGQLGMLGDASENNIVSRYAAAAIPVGRVVVFDTTNGKVKLPAAATDILDANSESRPVEGVIVHSQAIESQAANTLGVAGANVPAYPANYEFSVLRKGVIWVWAEEAVTITDQVFVRHTAAGNEKPGNVRNDAATVTCALLKGARFASVTTGAGLVLLEVNLPQ